jgi:HEAT repeat protein
MRTSILLVIAGVCLQAQQPEIENARLETRAFAGTLQAELTGFGAGPFWAGWSAPIISGRHGDMCWTNGNFGGGRAPSAPVRLEGQTALVVLLRMEKGQVDEVRVTSPDCRLDAGGLPFYWLTGEPAGESVGWLKSQVTEKKADQAILAIALHSDAAATAALEDLSSAGQPARIRERTAFWLGNSRGAQGLEALKRMLANDPSNSVREQVVFAISQSKEPSALATLIETARSDRTPQVRSRALFWLAQKAGDKQTLDAVSSAAANDPDRSVREQAVFALKQMPESKGIPLLIDIAKNNPDPAVRKKAMFWLGQSNDRRAVDFFADVLK